MIKLLIYGASGLGRELLDMIHEINKQNCLYEVSGWIDDGIPSGTVINNVEVLGDINYIKEIKEAPALIFAIASPHIKESLYTKVRAMRPEVFFPTIVHPSSSVSPFAQLEEGVIVSRYCWVAANTKLGKFVFLNTRCDIGHDSVVGDFSSLMPSVNISGNVTVGAKTLIGVQAAVHQGIKIGEESVVGIGSKVLADVPNRSTVFGNPARIIKRQ